MKVELGVQSAHSHVPHEAAGCTGLEAADQHPDLLAVTCVSRAAGTLYTQVSAPSRFEV